MGKAQTIRTKAFRAEVEGRFVAAEAAWEELKKLDYSYRYEADGELIQVRQIRNAELLKRDRKERAKDVLVIEDEEVMSVEIERQKELK